MMLDLTHLSKPELLTSTKQAVRDEKKAIELTICHLYEVNKRRAYLPEYASLFEYLVEEHGYCRASASLRMNAVRLMLDVPEAKEKVASGEISLTVAANVQTFLAQEKRENQGYSMSQKLELIEFCENKSVRDVQAELVKRNPEVFERDHIRQVSEDKVRVSHNSNNELEKKLSRIKELWSHVDPYMSREQMLERMADIVLERIDPVRKAERAKERKEKSGSGSAAVAATAAVSVQFAAPVLATASTSATASETATASASESESVSKPGTKTTSAPELKPASITQTPVHAHEQRFTKPTRYVPARVRHAVYRKHDGQGCTHVDQATGRRCGSRFQLQYDHIKPWAMGGAHRAENLRLLCAQHNRWPDRT